MPKIDTGIFELNYIDEGQGPVVMLLHGLAGDHKAWTPQIEVLKQKYRVIALDNPGCGQSSLVSKPTSMAEIGNSVIELMNKIGIDKAHLIGRSMGGAIAQEMTFVIPERIKSLALAGSFTKLDAVGVRIIENMRDYIQRDPDWARWTREYSYTFVSPEYFAADAARMARLEGLIADDRRDRPSYVNLANAVLAESTVGRLRNVKCPVLVMAGRRDLISTVTTTRWISEELPSAKVVFFEDSGHFFLMEEPQKANATILQWVEQNEA